MTVYFLIDVVDDFGSTHNSIIASNRHLHTDKCKSIGSYYKELVQEKFRTGVGVKWRKR